MLKTHRAHSNFNALSPLLAAVFTAREIRPLSSLLLLPFKRLLSARSTGCSCRCRCFRPPLKEEEEEGEVRGAEGIRNDIFV